MSTFTHHPRGDGEFTFDPTRTYEQKGPRQFKPHGFWLSVDDDWRRWCSDEGMSYADAEPVPFAVDTDHVLWLTTVGEIDAFTDEYEEPGSGPFGVYIDWSRVSERHAGIVIAPYQWQRRLDGRAHSWYYPWDCASACVWDLSALSVTAREQVSA